MPAKKTMAQRLGQALETMTRQCGQLPETPAYGSWLLGRVSESPSRRWVRIKRIVTVYIMTANLTGIVVALLVVTFAFPVPSIYTTPHGGSPSGSHRPMRRSHWPSAPTG